MSQLTDDENLRPTGQKRQKWSGGQRFYSGNQSEAHMEQPRKNIVNR